VAKTTAIIDIGSNSIRMLVFKKTSRFGFFLLNESKFKARISESSYQNGGYLQESAMHGTNKNDCDDENVTRVFVCMYWH